MSASSIIIIIVVVITPWLSPTDDNSNCRVDTAIIQQRLPVLLKYLNSDTERQLQALYALQALIVSLDQPPSEYRFLPPSIISCTGFRDFYLLLLFFLSLSERMALQTTPLW